MTTSPALLDPVRPDVPALDAGGSSGFLDCRGVWHAWTEGDD
jgi:hypothetical protein